MRTPRRSRRVAAAPSGSPDARMCPGQGAQDIRAWEPGHRSVEVAVLTFRAWHVCARCHRNKKNLHAIFCSGSELVPCTDHLRLFGCMRTACSCHTRLCRQHRQTGSSNMKARSTLQSRADVGTYPTLRIYGQRQKSALSRRPSAVWRLRTTKGSGAARADPEGAPARRADVRPQ